MEASKLSNFHFSFYTFNPRALKQNCQVKLESLIFLLQWRSDLLSMAAGLETDQSKVLGAFSSVFGPQNLAVLVWRHKHIDTASRVSSQLHNSPAGNAECDGAELISDLMLHF